MFYSIIVEKMCKLSELTREADSDRASVSRDEGSTKESLDEKKNQRPPQLDIPPASSNLNSKKPSMVSIFIILLIFKNLHQIIKQYR